MTTTNPPPWSYYSGMIDFSVASSGEKYCVHSENGRTYDFVDDDGKEMLNNEIGLESSRCAHASVVEAATIGLCTLAENRVSCFAREHDSCHCRSADFHPLYQR